MSLKRYSPFNIDIVGKIKSPSPPDDLKNLIDQLFYIQRFVDEKYPPGIFFDNVGEHEFRLVTIIDAAKIGSVDIEALERIIWIHDIPELVTGEYISPRKLGDKKLALRLGKQELEAAIDLLSFEDVEYFKSFNSSSKYLKGEGNLEGVTKEGLIACILDKIDGNMFFHHSLARWVNEGNGDREIPSKTAMEFTFKQRELYFGNLDKLPQEFTDLVKDSKRVLDYQIDFIVSTWNSIPKYKQPQIIKEQLKIYASETSKFDSSVKNSDFAR